MKCEYPDCNKNASSTAVSLNELDIPQPQRAPRGLPARGPIFLQGKEHRCADHAAERVVRYCDGTMDARDEWGPEHIIVPKES